MISESAFPVSNRRLALATLALLVSAAPAMAQNFDAPPGSCGYYINSLGHAVPRPCGDWHRQAPPSDATARCGNEVWRALSKFDDMGGVAAVNGGTEFLRQVAELLQFEALSGQQEWQVVAPGHPERGPPQGSPHWAAAWVGAEVTGAEHSRTKTAAMPAGELPPVSSHRPLFSLPSLSPP